MKDRKGSQNEAPASVDDDIPIVDVLIFEEQKTEMEKRENLFLEKISECIALARRKSFVTPNVDFRAQQVKMHRELFCMVTERLSSSSAAELDDFEYEGIFDLFRLIAFRPAPPILPTFRAPCQAIDRLLEEEDFYLDEDEGPPPPPPSTSPQVHHGGISSSLRFPNDQAADRWSTYEPVYLAVLGLFESPTFNHGTVRNTSLHSSTFIPCLLAAFDTAAEDRRERELLKMILHRIYRKCLTLRGPIRQAMRDIFHSVIHADERHQLVEILEILESIINGFAVPLRDEHLSLLQVSLLPLLQSRYLPLFLQSLQACLLQFIAKDLGFLSPVLRKGLLRHWPVGNSSREMLFLGFLHELILFADSIIKSDTGNIPSTRWSEQVLGDIFARLAKCSIDTNCQVAFRALQLWSDETFVRLAYEHTSLVITIFLPQLQSFGLGHWSEEVRGQVNTIMDILRQMNTSIFDAHSVLSFDRDDNLDDDDDNRIGNIIYGTEGSKVDKEEKWKAIEEAARRNLLQRTRTDLKQQDSSSS